MLKETNQFDNLITHSTRFHADDVFSTALLKIINPRAEIIRTLDIDWYVKNLKSEAIVYDIGRGKYDHHQENTEVRKNGIKYASFGLLWRDFGDWEQYPKFDEDFVQKIDEHDNGGKTFDISLMIESFNLTSDEKEFTYPIDEFSNAVEIAKKYLIRIFTNYDEENKSGNYIYDNGIYLDQYGILVLPKHCKYSKYVYENIPNCRVVIYPSEREGYNCQVVTISPSTMESIYTFPKEWCGQPEDKLPEGVKFVHNSGFLLVTETLQQAYEYAKTVKTK